MKMVISFIMLVSFLGCQQGDNPHHRLKDNFTINRLIIQNENNEILMIRDQGVWTTPSLLYNKRQYIKESLDSLAKVHGVAISQPQLRGHFSFKYDYRPYATIRNYYVAKHTSGNVIVPEAMEKALWMPAAEAIEINSVTAIKQITNQIITYPDVVWGGSFLVSHVGDDHPTKQVEEFYPLFEREN